MGGTHSPLNSDVLNGLLAPGSSAVHSPGERTIAESVLSGYPFETQWLPGFGFDDLTLDNQSRMLWLNLYEVRRRLFPNWGFLHKTWILSLARYKTVFNEGTYPVTGEDGESLGTISPKGYATLWRLGLGVSHNRWSVAGGLDHEQVHSEKVFTMGGPVAQDTETKTYDMGLNLQWRPIEIPQ